MKNLYIGIAMILLTNHQSYYGLTSLDFLKPYPISDIAMIGLLLVKVLFCFALTHFLISYSKIDRLISTEIPVSKIILIASVAILVMSTHFRLISQKALVTDISQICIFFTLVHMFVQKQYSLKAASN